MNPSDLLYTNSFVNTNPLTQQEVQRNANEYIPYRNLKGETVNNVRDELERTGFTDSSMNRVAKEANPWSRGYYGNQQPFLSDFGKDIAESSYFKYRSNYINIDSRMRDVGLYPTPNNYSIFLGRKFNNVETVKLIDYFFPEMEYPINSTNNVILWYTIPFEIIIKNTYYGLWNYDPYLGSDYDEYKINICGWYINFSNLIQTTTIMDDFRELYNNNLLSCMNKIEIPSGFYTTEQLSEKIRDEFQKTLFFNSNIYNKSYKEYSGNAGSETFKFKDRPQLVNVRIDPETSNVQFLLRYEEFRVKSVATYYNKNYFDLEMKVVDSSVPSAEFLELIQNDLYPLVITGFPEIGGYDGSNIDYIEFVPKNIIPLYQSVYGASFYKTYYDKITDKDGNTIPNVLRFYVYNLGNYNNIDGSVSIPVKSSYTEIVNNNNIQFGREAPFFLINGNMSLFSNYITYIKNNISNVSSLYQQFCEDEKNNCTVVSTSEELILDSLIVNVDCSSRLLTNLLGFQNTMSSKSIIGPSSGTFAIITNNIYKSNRYINSIQDYNINIDKFIDYTKCAGLDPPNIVNQCISNYTFWIDYYPKYNVNYRLPVSRNQNGTYSFYLNNYFFMKILSSSVGTQIQTSSTITQIKPTANFANGSSDIYELNNGISNGIRNYIDDPSYVNPKCPVNLKTDNLSSATKDLNNLFAKIKYSSVSGNYEVDNRFVNEIIFESNTINNLDEFVVQLVDYEGKILPQIKEHNFTLLIVEKYEVLKETNINSRNNNANTGGIRPVERNSFSNS